MKAKHIFSLLSFAAIALFSSCSKGDKGATGPVGIAGPTGVQGVQGTIGQSGPVGPQGITGVQGPTGPAAPAPTVTYSSWAAASWTVVSTTGQIRTRYSRPAPGITAASLSTSVVLTFMRNPPTLTGAVTGVAPTANITGQVVPLPYTDANRIEFPPASGTFANYTNEWVHALPATGGTINFEYRATGIVWTVSVANFNSLGIEYRYVLIPGGIAGGRITSGPAAGYTVDQVKAMSYDQVRSMFNIPADGSNEK
ncbi:MAG: hypothetical protein ACK5DG_00155 [Chitinophagaceae bacterium]|jgi:hypothetical protein